MYLKKLRRSLIDEGLYYSYRRGLLDDFLERSRHYFRGNVLDIGGGRQRGNFVPPNVRQWIIADINHELNTDIVCDIQSIGIKDNSIDTIKATEIFEHVKDPKKGLKECYRVLKGGGHMIMSVPFMFPVHEDPHDYQRYTEIKWKELYKEIGFQIEEINIMGMYFTVLGDMIKALIKSMPKGIRHLSYILVPFLNLIIKLDNSEFIKNHSRLGKFHGGYFILLRRL